MAALLGATEVGIKDNTEDTTVPDDPKARLMYYLECVCSVLNLDDDPDINRLRKFQRYVSSRNIATDIFSYRTFFAKFAGEILKIKIIRHQCCKLIPIPLAS